MEIPMPGRLPGRFEHRGPRTYPAILSGSEAKKDRPPETVGAATRNWGDRFKDSCLSHSSGSGQMHSRMYKSRANEAGISRSTINELHPFWEMDEFQQ